MSLCNHKVTYPQIIALTVFGIAMGFLEAAVVVYLRDLYYPEGFSFPLKPMDHANLSLEYFREISTIVMLVSVSFLAGKKFSLRLSFFLYGFGMWDIFYYVFLRILIGWPESLMTWDVLFLLPVTWTGPVLTPLIVTMMMILLAFLVLWSGYRKGQEAVRIPGWSWVLLTAGSLILITAFSWDYSGFVLEKMSFSDIWTLPQSQVHAMVHEYVPRKFNWILFSLGSLVILGGIGLYWNRLIRK